MTEIQISGFEMLCKLGQGGMATVWKARQLSLDRMVAIKILSSRLASDPDDLQRFRQESQSAAKLKHAGIVQVYDASIENGLYFFVMEFVAGYTCAAWQKRSGQLAEKDVLLIADCVADALGYAWERERMIHCDIKPDNIMIDDDGTVKVMDLGLARTISTMSSGVSDDILGTPAYMAPEQAMGEPGLDCRTDMYSLGATLYHLATGMLPFEGSGDEEVMVRQVKDFLPNPRDLNPSLSRGFCRLVEVMMAKEQAGRPLDWQTVREAIRYVRKGLMPRLTLMEGMVSTVLPSASSDPVLQHRLAGDPVAALETHAKRKPFLMPIVGLLLLAGLAVAFLLMQGGGGRRTGQGPSAPLPQASQPQAQTLPAEPIPGREIYERAVAWEKQYPAQRDGAIERYRRVAEEAAGTPYEARAKRDMERLEAANREQAIAGVVASLERETGRLLADHDYESAIERLAAYSGEFASETLAARTARVADLRREQAQWLEAERLRIGREREARVNALLDRVAGVCMDGDFSSALLHTEQALEDALLAGADNRLRDLSEILKRAVQIDEAILDTFARQAGQQVTVELKSGSVSRLINSARGDVIYASEVLDIRGMKASRTANFTLKDLAVNERLRRMGSEAHPHVNLVKGVMACEFASFEHARRFFAATDERLAPRLIALAETRELRFNRDLMTRSLGTLMGRAGLATEEEFNAGSWIGAVQAAALPPAQAVALRQAATDFQQTYQHTAGYDQVADVVAAIMAIRAEQDVIAPRADPVALPAVALSNDIAAMVGNPDAVMERLLADNRSMVSGDVDMRRDAAGRVIGIRIRSSAISDIRALAALRDLRSFELRAAGGRETAPLSDITPLAGLPLETVVIEGAAVDNLKPLTGLPLRTLRIPRTIVRDLSPLAGMLLETIDLSGTRVFDFKPLSLMPVKSFAASNSQLRDLGFMRNWRLESVDISATGVFDFSVLSRMPLKRVKVGDTQISRLDILQACPLEELDIAGSAVRDLNPLTRNAATLRRLTIDRLPLRNPDALRALNLDFLSMEGTKTDDLRLISHMQLEVLRMNDTPLAALDGLDTSRLAELQINGTRVTSLQPIQGARALRRLFCRQTKIRNFMPLHDSGITHLFIDDPGSKTATFRQMPSLEFVNWESWFR